MSDTVATYARSQASPSRGGKRESDIYNGDGRGGTTIDQRIVRKTARGLSLVILAAATLLGLSLLVDGGVAQADMPTTHTIFVTGMEVKGATTTDELAPPALNPTDLSKGYGFKAPGKVDKKKPQKWQVASYVFTPSFVTVHQGDTVKLTVFIVNGNKHEVYVTAPDGKRVIPARIWNRGREYKVEFIAEKAGTYQLICSEHAPSMAMTFLVLAR